MLAETTDWMLRARARTDVRDALAGATPYLRMFALVVGGWLMARQALAAKARRSAPATATPRSLEAKVVTARFYAEQLLPGGEGPGPAGHRRPRGPVRRRPGLPGGMTA